MIELFKAVRGEASTNLWSKGVSLARSGSVVGERDDGEEVLLKVSVPGQTVSPTVSLYPDDEEWACDCGGPDPCEHVVAAVIALKLARERGEDLPKARGAASKRAPAQV